MTPPDGASRPPAPRPPAARPIIELRDPLHGPIGVNAGELSIIDTPIFQRLRGIKQLGFAEFVFPGAVHHRYLHSIGAMHVGGRLAERVLRDAALSDAERSRLTQLVRLAALLHDVGHAPMSHAAEALLPRRRDLPGGGDRAYGGLDDTAGHEEITLLLVTASEIAEAIDREFADVGITAAQVAAVIDAQPGAHAPAFVLGGLDYWPLLHAMVSGELDVDRMDYLRRDSYFAGVEYGAYDQAWLLSNATLVEDAGAARLAIDLRALPTFEHFLLARYHMFQMVYFHPKSDIYDAMLRSWLATAGDDTRFPASPDAYVDCDDAWLMARLRASDDPWARRIARRKPYSLLVELRSDVDKQKKPTIEDALKASGVDLLWIEAKPILSRYAQSPAELRTNPLWVVDHRPPLGRARRHRVEDVTDLFGRYERVMRLERLYVPPEQRNEARAILERLG